MLSSRLTGVTRTIGQGAKASLGQRSACPSCKSLFQLPLPRTMSSVPLEQHRVTLSDGQTLGYAVTGNGPRATLLMPGALGTGRTDFPTLLEGLNSQDQLTVVAWDPPGYGSSRPHDRTFPLNFFDRDAEVAVEFMSKIGHEKFNVVGWSDGGITGLVMAATFPARVDRLVLWGANSFISAKDIEKVSGVKDVSQWSERMRKPMEDVYGKEYFPKLWEEWVNAYQAIFDKNGGEVCANRLKDIKCPTFIIHGDKDAMVDEVHPDHMNKNIQGSRLHRFPDGKHNLHLKYKVEFNKMVEDFLTE